MLRTLDADRPRAASIARGALVAACLIVVAGALVHGWNVLVQDPVRPSLLQVEYVAREGDYLAWTPLWGGPHHVEQVRWQANGTVDRVLLVRQGDVPTLLAGGQPPIVAELPRKIVDPSWPEELRFSEGRAILRAPPPDCPPPTGGCRPETTPVLVWIKGDAWEGLRLEDRSFDEVWQEEDGTRGGSGPVRPEITRTNAFVFDSAPWFLATGAIVGGLGLVAGAAWVFLESRVARAPHVGPGKAPGAGTEEMLLVVRITSMYVESIRRSLYVAAAVIAALTAGVMGIALPPVLAMARAQFALAPDHYAWHVAYFAALPLFLAAAAGCAWATSYVRVRADLQRWRVLARRFDEEARRILGA